ncbi:MAG: CHAD domain-containing protein [Actinobacteria bacterium]|nr:CHAD domain-containing protein [Actinomycetota bacterium]
MAAGSHEFVFPAGAAAGSDVLRALNAAKQEHLGWANGGQTQTRRRTWLDTFDWRLHRAGLTLEQVISGHHTDLVLTGPEGEVVVAVHLAAGSRPSWPSRACELPAGPLRTALEPVTGVRALCPVARAVSKLAELQALNDDDKTVARLSVDRMTLTFPARTAVPARLTLVPVRGYQAQAEKLGRTIDSLPGITAGRESALATALAVAGRRPGEVPGKPMDVQLAPEMPAAQAMGIILTALLDTMEANVPGTIRDIDTEFLHDLRVAVRRTRSALKLCGDALPAGLASRYSPEFRWLGDLTTPTRDLDVFLLGYDDMASGIVGGASTDLMPFRDHLASAREAAYRRLVSGLRSARFARLRSNWRASLAQARTTRRTTVAQLADARIGAAHRKALHNGRRITSASPSESLHKLRKRCKELRYLVEMFGSLHDPAQRSQAVRELKALQDCLGEFQDAEVQRTEIRAIAAEMMRERSAPAETLLAMGEIAAGLAVRQASARAQFAGRFADFAGPASRGRLAALAGGT